MDDDWGYTHFWKPSYYPVAFVKTLRVPFVIVTKRKTAYQVGVLIATPSPFHAGIGRFPNISQHTRLEGMIFPRRLIRLNEQQL